MPVPVACGGPGFLVLLAVALSAAPAPGQPDPSGVAWDERIEVAVGGGYRGPWRMNEFGVRVRRRSHRGHQRSRSVVGVGWADQSRKDIFLQIYEPDGQRRFAAPVNVSGSPHIFSWLPRMLLTSGDASEVSILWQEIVFSGGSHGGEIFFARSTDGGTDLQRSDQSLESHRRGRQRTPYPALLAQRQPGPRGGPQGDLYAAWTEYEGTLWVSRSTDRGGSFSAPLRIAGGGDAKPTRGPSLAVDAEGAVHLAWTVGEDDAADIHVAKSVDRGRSFGEPRVVFESDGHADAPKIAVDGKGTLHLVYAESPAGPFKRYHIRYTRSNDGGATFEEPREISSPQTEPFESASFPALDLDGEGDPYVGLGAVPSREHRPRDSGSPVRTMAGERSRRLRWFRALPIRRSASTAVSRAC